MSDTCSQKFENHFQFCLMYLVCVHLSIAKDTFFRLIYTKIQNFVHKILFRKNIQVCRGKLKLTMIVDFLCPFFVSLAYVKVKVNLTMIVDSFLAAFFVSIFSFVGTCILTYLQRHSIKCFNYHKS